MTRTSTRVIVLALCAVSRPITAQTLTTLFSFNGAQGSGSTQGPPVQGQDGLFYGAIQTGGTKRDGALFKITPGGTLTTLYSFSGSDGKYPSSGVTLGPDGNFYGTTWIGGNTTFTVNGQGIIFKITATGTFTILHEFSGSDAGGSGLTLGPDGNFYGTTSGGAALGTNGSTVSYTGTVFKISPSGTFTSLYSFGGGGIANAIRTPSSGLRRQLLRDGGFRQWANRLRHNLQGHSDWNPHNHL
jgi:uncharacterized repeat protein (TIGR03803 family)